MDSNLNSWQETILDFFENSIAKSSVYKSRKYIKEKENELTTNDEEKRVKARQAIEARVTQLNEERRLAPKTEINVWLTETASKNIAIGKRIIKVTHTAKFTHSSANNDGLLVQCGYQHDKPYLCSDTMRSLTYDFAHHDGALISVSRFLALSKNNQTILDLILQDDFSFLEGFYLNKEQLDTWQLDFSKIVEKRNINTCDKIKSLYFPVTDNYTDYHLLTPLYATSLSEQIFQDRNKSKYTKRSNTFNPIKDERTIYANMAFIHFGGKNIQNVSMLNTNRGARGYVFSCQPPVWKQQDKAYQKQVKIFDNGIIRYRASETIDFLTDFIIRFQNLELSFADPKRKVWLEQWVNEILKATTEYADEIIFGNQAGWTDNTPNQYKNIYKYWLDPYHPKEAFQTDREQIDWQAKISEDFAKWLANVISYNAQKKQKNVKITKWLTSLFRDLASDAVRIHTQNINKLHYDHVNKETSK